jgi:hypothetical protein
MGDQDAGVCAPEGTYAMTWTPDPSNPSLCPPLDSARTVTFDAQGFTEGTMRCPDSCGACSISPAVGSECTATVEADGPCPTFGLVAGASIRTSYAFRGDTVTVRATATNLEGFPGTCTFVGTGTRS